MAGIGTPMSSRPPGAPGSAPSGTGFYQGLASFLGEVKAAIEGPLSTSDADVRHGTRKLMLHHASFTSRTQDYITIGNYVQPENATDGNRKQNANSGAPSNPLWCAIPLSVGDRILEIDLYVEGVAGVTGNLKVWKFDMAAAAIAGTATQLGATVTSASATTVQTLARTGLTEVVADGFGYFISATLGANLAYSVRGARILFDRP